LDKALTDSGLTEFSPRFLLSEWINVVDPWQIATDAAYASVPRTGRAQRLGAQQRSRLWPLFEQVRRSIHERGMFTWSQVMSAVAEHYSPRSEKPFTHIIVDEAQDL